MNFYESVTHALYCRMEDGLEFISLLEDSAEYEKRRKDLLDSLKVLDQENAGKVTMAAQRMCDLHSQFFYRVGLQDGARLMLKDFLVRGIDPSLG